jgi:hypothetical protein
MWLLPHRLQSGEVEVIESGSRRRLRDAINVTELPLPLTLGVPESVLEAHSGDDLIYAQYARQCDGNRDIFALSVRCGKDNGGRTVYLTGLQMVVSPADLELPPLDEPGLPEPEHKALDKLRERFLRRAADDGWVASVYELMDAVTHEPFRQTFANVENPRARYPHDWAPRSKKKLSIRIGAMLALICLLTLAIVVLASRGCA